jgi:hypothetical protein
MFLIHIAIGLMFIVSPSSIGGKAADLPPPFFGWIFLLAGSFAFISGWTMAVCLLFAAGFLRRRTHHLFCIVIAGLSCLFFPFGTALGVFSLIVLLRPSVKAVFEHPH